MINRLGAESGNVQCMKRILLHEYLMGALLIQASVRLAIKGCFNEWFFAFLGVFAAYSVLIYYGIKTSSLIVNKARLFSNLVVMFFAYSSTKYTVPVFFGDYTYDAKLTAIDNSILGTDLSHSAQDIYSPILTDLMSVGYMSYYVVIAATFLYFGFVSSIEKFCKYCMGFFIVFGTGIIFYSIIPALGPYVYFKGTYVKELTGGFLTELNNFVVQSGSAKFDVFPSLHMGVSLFILLFLFFNGRKGFYTFLIPFLFLISSTIYLRYHYFIDLICGAILSIIVFAVTSYVSRKHTPNIVQKEEIALHS